MKFEKKALGDITRYFFTLRGGIIGWQNHEVVSVLFKRTVEAIKEIRDS